MKTNDKNLVLIVDDSDSEAELAELTIKSRFESVDIKKFKDGKELMEYLTCQCLENYNNTIKLIFLDLNMPRLSGLEALKLIKNNIHLKKIPVTVLTSSDSVADVSTSYQVGANSYIRKSIDFDTFRQSITLATDYWININYTCNN